MKNKTLRFFAAAAAFLLLFALLFGWASRLLNDKMSVKYDGEFYQGGEEYEVLLFGSSHMMNSVYPLELYRQTGIYSYNLGMTNEGLCPTYWRIRQALETHTPQVIVVEVSGVAYGLKTDVTDPSAQACLHNSLDSMPLGLTKVQAVVDLFGWRDLDSIFNFLFPLALYHDRWHALSEDDFAPWLLADKGALPIRSLFTPDAPLSEVDPDWVEPGGEAGVTYLLRIVELCRQKDIQLVLLNVPYLTSDRDRAVFNGIPALLEGKDGVRYYNLFQSDLLDVRIDLSDAVGHLNTAGAARLTAWLGEELRQNYDLPDHRGEAGSERWEQEYGISTAQHLNKLTGAGDLNTALMLLDHAGLGYRLQLTQAARGQEQTALLLARLGGEEAGSVPPGSPELPGEGCALLVWQEGKDEPAQLLTFPG